MTPDFFKMLANSSNMFSSHYFSILNLLVPELIKVIIKYQLKILQHLVILILLMLWLVVPIDQGLKVRKLKG
jgi:hypothetical protein